MGNETDNKIQELEKRLSSLEQGNSLTREQPFRRLLSRNGLSFPVYPNTPSRCRVGDVCAVLNAFKTGVTFKKCTGNNTWVDF